MVSHVYATPTFEAWTDDSSRGSMPPAPARRDHRRGRRRAGGGVVCRDAPRAGASAVCCSTPRLAICVTDDYPIGASVDEVDALLVALVRAPPGERSTSPCVRPKTPVSRTLSYSSSKRTPLVVAATPWTAAAQFDYIFRHVDVRDALPLVQAPTRVLHVRDNRIVPMGSTGSLPR